MARWLESTLLEAAGYPNVIRSPARGGLKGGGPNWHRDQDAGLVILFFAGLNEGDEGAAVLDGIALAIECDSYL
jgi:hypothetical protein